MTLSEFCTELEPLASKASPEDARIMRTLQSATEAWKDSPDSVGDLVQTLDRTLGHSWISRDELHPEVARRIDELRAQAEALPGMTMNERLLTFGLMDAWDAASEATRRDLRNKLGST